MTGHKSLATAQRASKAGPTIYAKLMDFALDEPRREVRTGLAKQMDAVIGNTATWMVEQLNAAYIAGVADEYRQAVADLEDEAG